MGAKNGQDAPPGKMQRLRSLRHMGAEANPSTKGKQPMKYLIALAAIAASSATAQTLPQAVERAAYVGGRCAAHFQPGDKERSMIQGSGPLMVQYNRGLADSRKAPVSRAVCVQEIEKSRVALERHLQR
jgi:hypothetical protein